MRVFFSLNYKNNRLHLVVRDVYKTLIDCLLVCYMDKANGFNHTIP